ncbi:MAG: hypothetical protein J0L75_20785 [Spirochaetes bacterium]|nr:hypothetical protein [Spirochaetota bacterium]
MPAWFAACSFALVGAAHAASPAKQAPESSFLTSALGGAGGAGDPRGTVLWAYDVSNRNYGSFRPKPAPAGTTNKAIAASRTNAAEHKTNASLGASASPVAASPQVSNAPASVSGAANPGPVLSATNLSSIEAVPSISNVEAAGAKPSSEAQASPSHAAPPARALAIAPLCNESGEARLDALCDLFPALLAQVVASLPSPPRLQQEKGLVDILFFMRNRWTPKVDAGLTGILVEKYELRWLLVTRLVAHDKQIFVEGRLLDLSGARDPKVEERPLPEDRGKYQEVASDLAKLLVSVVPAP